jgi:Trypsin-co-occurring domain 2
MSERDTASPVGLRLSEAIEQLRNELLRARASGAASDVQLPIESMTVELALTVTLSADGTAGFTVPVVGLRLGGGGGRERESGQKVTIIFGGPVDREGHPVKVAKTSDILPD